VKAKSSAKRRQELIVWLPFSKVLVLVAILLGVSVIGVAFRGVQIKIEMEP
jgi:hypothetical protein